MKFTVAPGQDARMAALERLGQVSRPLAGHVAADGLALCNQDFEITYVDLSGKPCSRKQARGGTAWLKARTRRKSVKPSGARPAPPPSLLPDDLLEDLAAALTDAAFEAIRATADASKE
ncbi:hypothetical protein [Nonomuraea endophytica]|uniref:hypothetical protein n=1 Tax=Nonomuraea endophytica TaxID=714136 RepID=UPI0037C55005